MPFPKTINDHFDQKYGEVGTSTRTDFEERANQYCLEKLDKNKMKIIALKSNTDQ